MSTANNDFYVDQLRMSVAKFLYSLSTFLVNTSVKSTAYIMAL